MKEEEEARAIMAVQTVVEAAKIPKEYDGPRDFANQGSIDYLLEHLRYQTVSALSGRPIRLNSLFTINEDIHTALRQDYPFLGSMIKSGFSDQSWYGSEVCPKYIHLDQQLMEVDFETTLDTCQLVTLDDLEHLAFIDRKTDEWLHNEQYTFNVFTLANICEHLKRNSGQIYLHMIIDNGEAFSRKKNPTKEKLKIDIGNRLRMFTAEDYSSTNNPLWQAIVEIYNSKFFPAELIIREACLTNLIHDESSCIYGHRYFYC